MAPSTRDRLLDTARTLFAERGFYGVSIANIAEELGLTKQALLHYFPTKEKLYGEVLSRISDELDALVAAARAANVPPADRVKILILSMVAETVQEKVRTRLLMRELLDNRRRAEGAGTWYLKAFLKDCITMVRAVPGWETVPEPQRLALIYQLLGAVQYHAISEETLRGIFGERTNRALRAVFADQLAALVTAALRATDLRPGDG